MAIAMFILAVALVADSQLASAEKSLDACTLLTGADVEAVLGDVVKDRKLTPQPSSDLLTSQCFFATSSSRSISLMLTVGNPRQHVRLTPQEYWRRQFHGGPDAKAEKEEAPSPRRIDGVGDEAFWMGNRFAGALYVLRGQAFLRVSVGGIRDEQERVEKSKALALAALKRL